MQKATKTRKPLLIMEKCGKINFCMGRSCNHIAAAIYRIEVAARKWFD